MSRIASFPKSRWSANGWPCPLKRAAQLLRQFDSVEGNEVGRDGVRIVKGLCKSENFRSLDSEVPVTPAPPPPFPFPCFLHRRGASTDFSFSRRCTRCWAGLRSSTFQLMAAALSRRKSFCSSSCSKSLLLPVEKQTQMLQLPLKVAILNHTRLPQPRSPNPRSAATPAPVHLQTPQTIALTSSAHDLLDHLQPFV